MILVEFRLATWLLLPMYRTLQETYERIFIAFANVNSSEALSGKETINPFSFLSKVKIKKMGTIEIIREQFSKSIMNTTK